MALCIQSNVTIQSQYLINRILNSPVRLPSYVSSFNPFSLLPAITPNKDPLSVMVLEPSIINERIDDIPVLVSILSRLNIPNIINELYTPHGNHEGLSPGWIATVWLVYILSKSDHRMNSVQGWVADRSSVLRAVTDQEMTEKDFTDDRLGRILELLADDALWIEIEKYISRHSIRAYDLSIERIRLDATTAAVNHNPNKHPLFQVGRTKQNTYSAQFKLMLGTLDPLGFPIATDVLSGEKADDPLYVPIYKRINNILEKSGILYIGDSKMGSIETRAVIHNDGNYYLMPLPMTGETPALLDKILSEFEAGKHETSNVFLPQDLPENPDNEPDPELALAKGFEITVERKTEIDGKAIFWNERICCVQSFRYAASESEALDGRLISTEQALKKLTPPPGPGKKQYQDEAKLKIAADKILKRYKVNGLIEFTIEGQESCKDIRAYKDNPARVETTVRYQIYTTRKSEAIEQTRKRLGWRLYATNEAQKNFNMTKVVLTYRDQYIVERNFARIKGRRLGITPLYVQRDDHACGLIRLLTIALRAMSIIEFSAHQKLLENHDILQGIYPGNPKRSTIKPSTDLMLEAFNGLNFFITDLPNGQHFEQISSLNDIQKKILYLLGLSESIYSKMTQKPQYGLTMNHVASEKFSSSNDEDAAAWRISEI